MTGTKPSWRVAVKKGDKLDVSATYDTSKASWYESMGIMVLFVCRRHAGRAPRTRSQSKIDERGLLTHGHLRENDHHGGKPRRARATPASLANGRLSGNLYIKGFVYERGDFNLRASAAARRSSRPGSRSRSRTSTRRPRSAPSSRRTTRSPRARRPVPAPPASPTRSPTASVQFDSGELGYGPPGSRRRRTATRGRRRRACKPGPTRTSAGSTRSCGARSEWSRTRAK